MKSFVERNFLTHVEKTVDFYFEEMLLGHKNY